MSRINRARIVDGDDVTAASLNDRFDDFSQANELDQFNLRDAAVDLPQFKKSPKFQAPFVQVDVLGKADLLHASPVSVSATGTSPYTSPHVVEDGAGTATIANYGASGLTIDSSQVFRVYWSLSVNAPSSSTPYRQGLQYNEIFGSGGGTNFNVSTSAGCFVAWLQWDITDNTLTNWQEVDGQGNFKTQLGTHYGNTVTVCQATTVIPLWSVWMANVNNGDSSAGTTEEVRKMGWRGVSGAWHYVSGGSVTIYGLRVVLLGVMHPRRASASAANGLVLDTVPASNVSLEYTGGRLVTFVNGLK